jgi:hypothetical protein
VGVSRQLGYHQHLTGNCLTGAEMQRAVQWTAPVKRPTACGSGGLRLAGGTMRPCSKSASRATEPSRGARDSECCGGTCGSATPGSVVTRDRQGKRPISHQEGSLWPVVSARGTWFTRVWCARVPALLRPPRNRQHHRSGRSRIRHRLSGFRGGADRLGHPSAAESDLGPRNSTDAESRRGAQDPVRRRAPGILGW